MTPNEKQHYWQPVVAMSTLSQILRWPCRVISTAHTAHSSTQCPAPHHPRLPGQGSALHSPRSEPSADAGSQSPCSPISRARCPSLSAHLSSREDTRLLILLLKTLRAVDRHKGLQIHARGFLLEQKGCDTLL